MIGRIITLILGTIALIFIPYLIGMMVTLICPMIFGITIDYVLKWLFGALIIVSLIGIGMVLKIVYDYIVYGIL